MKKFNLYTLAIVILSCSLPSTAKEVNEQLSVVSDVQVNIENLRGKVMIEGTDSNIISVAGKLDEQATDFVFKQQGNVVLVHVEMPHNLNQSFWDENSHKSDLKIYLPRSSEVIFQGVSSDVSIENIAKDINIHTISGNVIAAEIGSNSNEQAITIETVSGDIITDQLSGKVSLTTVSGNLEDNHSQGRIAYQSVSGDISVNSAATEINANAVSGDMQLNLTALNELKLSTVSGNVEGTLVLANSGFVKASTVSGNVSLGLQENVNVDIKVHSNAGGKIYNEVSDEQVKEAKHGPSSTLKTILGNGSAKLKVSTMSGTIKLHH